MRIGIDARELCGHPTGVGRYLGGLLAMWATDASAKAHEFVLYTPEQVTLPHGARHFSTRIVPGPGSTWWEQVRLPAAIASDRLDVFFAPGYSAPLLHRTPVVVALHDLSFVAHPEWFTTQEGLRRRWLSRRSAARAAAVVTISQFSRRELVEHMRIPDDRIHVIPPGITPPARTTAPRADGLRARVLYVGSIFNRRRLPDLIRAFTPIAREYAAASLDIVGDNRSYPRQNLARLMANANLGEQARWRSYVTEEELAELFATARAFAFLSEYEGLGLTPLESLAAGVPPVLLDTAVARESCREAALYVEKGDLAATTRALRTLLFDDDRRATLLAAAPGALAQYSWPRAAQATLALLEGSGQ